MLFPRNVTVPSVCFKICEIVFKIVVFPAPFGPKNFKKAHKIVSVVEYINTHNIKEKWRINKEGYTELIEVI